MARKTQETTDGRLTTTGIRPILADAQAELEKVAAKHGLTLRFKGHSLDSELGVYGIRFEFQQTDEQSEKRAFLAFADQYGLSEKHYGATFDRKGTTYTVIGFNPSRPKFCVKTRRTSDGAEFAFASTILRLIDADAYAKSTMGQYDALLTRNGG